MISLKELMECHRSTNSNDIEIIRLFFDKNDLEMEGIDLINDLMKIKVSKLKQQHRVASEWASYFDSMYLYEHYDHDVANRLHNLMLDYITHGCELTEPRLSWAKKNIPDIEIPEVYFQPLIEYLDRRGIRFKGEQPIETYLFT